MGEGKPTLVQPQGSNIFQVWLPTNHLSRRPHQSHLQWQNQYLMVLWDSSESLNEILERVIGLWFYDNAWVHYSIYRFKKRKILPNNFLRNDTKLREYRFYFGIWASNWAGVACWWVEGENVWFMPNAWLTCLNSRNCLSISSWIANLTEGLIDLMKTIGRALARLKASLGRKSSWGLSQQHMKQ